MKFLLSLFGICLHTRLTFPQTPVRRSRFGATQTGATYSVCLDCGREFEKELGSMKLGAEIRREPAHANAPVERLATK